MQFVCSSNCHNSSACAQRLRPTHIALARGAAEPRSVRKVLSSKQTHTYYTVTHTHVRIRMCVLRVRVDSAKKSSVRKLCAPRRVSSQCGRGGATKRPACGGWKNCTLSPPPQSECSHIYGRRGGAAKLRPPHVDKLSLRAVCLL